MSWGECDKCPTIGNVYSLTYGETVTPPLCFDCRRIERNVLKARGIKNIRAEDK